MKAVALNDKSLPAGGVVLLSAGIFAGACECIWEGECPGARVCVCGHVAYACVADPSQSQVVEVRLPVFINGRACLVLARTIEERVLVMSRCTCFRRGSFSGRLEGSNAIWPLALIVARPAKTASRTAPYP